MYKNIIFDIGGVLINFNPRDFLLERFFNETLEQRIFDLTFGSEEWKLLDAGQISRREANQRMLANAKELNCEFEVQTVIDDWITMLTTRQKTAMILAQLKASGYRVFYLTNMPEDIFEQLQQRSFWRCFDGGIASCEVHINKPDPAIYRALMSKYSLVYDETVFIDDSKVNAQSACNLGMAGILYKGNNSLVRALKSCGVTVQTKPRKRSAEAAKK